MAKVPDAYKYCRNLNRLSSVHEHYRRQTDDRRTGDSMLTFAKNDLASGFPRNVHGMGYGLKAQMQEGEQQGLEAKGRTVSTATLG